MNLGQLNCPDVGAQQDGPLTDVIVLTMAYRVIQVYMSGC